MATLAAARDAARPRTITLPGGTLDVTVEPGGWPLDDLCAFAARDNARRGWLVVSRVLGRHLPARPSAMRAAMRALAERLPGHLPGPVLFVGLAETATALGQGVHREWRRLTDRDDTLYLHTTRQRAPGPLLARFEEAHSHAAAHLIHAPLDPAHAARLTAARSLVLVDDEASTGTTFVNLAAALLPDLPRLEAIGTAVLADWSGTDYLAVLPRPASAAALLNGRLRWRAGPSLALAEHPPASRCPLGTVASRPGSGRQGLVDDPPVADLARRLDELAGRPALALGFGEHAWVPFALAEALEASGIDILVQTASRSPVRVGGPILSRRELPDTYGADVPNYVYNLEASAGRQRLLLCETGFPIQAAFGA